MSVDIFAATELTQTSAEYLRIAAVSVAAYEFVLTAPAEYRFYAAQSRWTWPSLACLLFILIRYSSVAAIVISNVGQFGSFSENSCNRYYIIAPIFKVIQTLICQVILFVRTYAVSRRSRAVATLLGLAFLGLSVGEAFSSIYARVPNYNTDGNHHCTSGNPPGRKVAWIHYVCSMTYDFLTLTISSYFLLGRQPWQSLSFSRVGRMMLVDGLGYFAMLTITNVVNIIFYKTAPLALQSAASSLGYTFVMIGCQRILIHLRDIADHSHNPTTKRPGLNGFSGGDDTNAHEMAIRITVQKDVEAYGDATHVTKSLGTLQSGSV